MSNKKYSSITYTPIKYWNFFPHWEYVNKYLFFSQQLKGEAEAYAIEAKAKAEAEQMARKADAWKDYQEAAMVDMVLETIPKVQTFLL